MKSRLILLSALALAMAPQLARADRVTHRVPADFPTIQAALNASAFGDIVLVASGTYYENLLMTNQHDGVRLLSEAGPQVTTIDGGHSSQVLRCSNVGSQTRIEGFTLANGRAEPFTPNNIGGCMKLYEADVWIENNIIRDNFAEAAGALYLDYSSPTLVRNVIRDNQALASGGAIYCDNGSNARIEHNVIARNSCGHFGGGVTIWSASSPQLISNTLVSNTATLGGGGIYITRDSDPEILRNIIAYNSSGSGIHRDDPSSIPSLACNDIWSNSPTNYVGLPDQTGINGNLSSDPLFCNFTALDLRLDQASPCAPDHSPAGCALIGALAVGCGPVAVESSTWGRIKALNAR